MEKERIYVLDMIYSAITCFSDVKGAMKGYYALRSFLPYLIRKEGEVWIPLNRDYKPIGILNAAWVDYGKYSFIGIPDRLVKRPEISLKRNSFYTDDGYLYFFNDSVTPYTTKNRAAYVKRIKEAFLDAYLKTL
jgi:hypothetical protein